MGFFKADKCIAVNGTPHSINTVSIETFSDLIKKRLVFN